MTFAYGAFALGAALLYSAFENASLMDVILGRKGESISAQGESHPSSETAQSPATGSVTPSGSGNKVSKGKANTGAKGLVKWTNPDGSTKLIAKWIYGELQRVGWHGYIESGYRSFADQVATCATGVQPCATPGTSNHEGKAFPKGAIDVRESECATLSAKLQAVNSPLVYAGSKDPVHFSHPHNGSY